MSRFTSARVGCALVAPAASSAVAQTGGVARWPNVGQGVDHRQMARMPTCDGYHRSTAGARDQCKEPRGTRAPETNGRFAGRRDDCTPMQSRRREALNWH